MVSLTQVLAILAASSLSLAVKTSSQLISLHEENWMEIMEGEWMVEFHAPWCPACKDLQKAWNAFADWSRDLNIKKLKEGTEKVAVAGWHTFGHGDTKRLLGNCSVGEVDVTVNPGLSGRFLVTALPTIYHVKDGVFRVYTGPRDKNDFITFIEDKRWRSIDPVPDYKHPNSKQMAVVAVFFKLSMAVRDLHNHLVEDKGVPSWASYSLFAGVTLALGCILGFFIVLIIDQVFPTGKKTTTQPKKDSKKDSNNGTKKAEDNKKKENSSPKPETKKSK